MKVPFPRRKISRGEAFSRIAQLTVDLDAILQNPAYPAATKYKAEAQLSRILTSPSLAFDSDWLLRLMNRGVNTSSGPALSLKLRMSAGLKAVSQAGSMELDDILKNHSLPPRVKDEAELKFSRLLSSGRETLDSDWLLNLACRDGFWGLPALSRSLRVTAGKAAVDQAVSEQDFRCILSLRRIPPEVAAYARAEQSRLTYRAAQAARRMGDRLREFGNLGFPHRPIPVPVRIRR